MGILTSDAAKRRLFLPAAVLGASTLLLASCGQAPEESGSNGETGSASATGAAAEVGSDNSDYKACIVSDEGGFDDRSFNQSSYEGLKAAEKEFGIQVAEAESHAVGDYVPNMNNMIDANCQLIVGVGYQLGETIMPISKDNSEIKFVGVDVTAEGYPDNVRNIIFDTAQAAFLAGYAAAGMTETGTVATYGGMEIPTVSIFMDGFARGVDHYNEVKNGNVKVLGWDKDARTGSFTGDFTNQNAGKTNTTNFINEGADIIMPVAGRAGLGTLDAIKEANAEGASAKAIWVDADGYETTNDGEVILTSVMKLMGDAVKNVIAEDLNDEFTPEAYVGTLENEGVALAPFHDFDGDVPQELKDELEQLRKDIISGEVEVGAEDSPEA
ncbi:MAG: BMP family ABC transporter substrate-binding protein [Micrococcus sp.]|nr:BMP family ABC transporter substrate-binding protein [Micrococcus sp.]